MLTLAAPATIATAHMMASFERSSARLQVRLSPKRIESGTVHLAKITKALGERLD